MQVPDKRLRSVVEAEVNSEQLITDAIGGIVAVPKMRSLEVFSTRVPAPKQRSIEGHATPSQKRRSSCGAVSVACWALGLAKTMG